MTFISQLSGRLATSLTPQDASSSAIRPAISDVFSLTMRVLSARDAVIVMGRLERDNHLAPAWSSARHTVSEVIGSEMSRTPRCQSASMTALPIAAGAPIAPLSLPPLTPSGLLGAGVSMKAGRKGGRADARGLGECKKRALR